jgi:hypothetical protein
MRADYQGRAIRAQRCCARGVGMVTLLVEAMDRRQIYFTPP